MIELNYMQKVVNTLEVSFRQLRLYLLDQAGDIAHKDKADGSPFTEADIYAEKVIAGDLKKVCGDIAVFGEEAGYNENALPETVWIIDPIDEELFFRFTHIRNCINVHSCE